MAKITLRPKPACVYIHKNRSAFADPRTRMQRVSKTYVLHKGDRDPVDIPDEYTGVAFAYFDCIITREGNCRVELSRFRAGSDATPIPNLRMEQTPKNLLKVEEMAKDYMMSEAARAGYTILSWRVISDRMDMPYATPTKD